MRAPASRNLNLLRKYVNHFKGLAPSNSGAFKRVWLDPHGRLPLVLKKCREREKRGWQEWEANDLMLEICAQHSNEDLSGAIVPYVAWGWIDGEFWALQPEVDYRDQLDDAIEDGEIDGYGEAVGIFDCQSDHNTGVYEGRAVSYDWGYAYQCNSIQTKVKGCWMEVVRDAVC